MAGNATEPGKTLIHGWGRYPKVEARRREPADVDGLRELLAGDQPRVCIARGGGLSYGDSALAGEVISGLGLRQVCELDAASGILRCAAGFTLREILREVVPKGWFPPVLPGAALVSVGGAVAADVHGKNHHRDGGFCDHVRELSLMLANGETLRCGPSRHPELFRATCGGMGLTGIIVEAELQLIPIQSSMMATRSLPAANLDACFDLLDAHGEARYSVAWLDCLARAPRMGRGMVYLAEHDNGGELRSRHHSSPGRRASFTMPFTTSGALLNRHSLSLFNSAYYRWQRFRAGSGRQDHEAYFFPLDRIRNWNRLYGAAGFLQYQFVLPFEASREGIAKVLRKAGGAGKGSFLSVLKKLGPASGNPLSFPIAGHTLALDFKHEASLFPLLEELDAIVLDHGGRIYLAKDARMSETVFKAGYPGWERFMEIKRRVDPAQRFRSAQSDRLGLTGPGA